MENPQASFEAQRVAGRRLYQQLKPKFLHTKKITFKGVYSSEVSRPVFVELQNAAHPKVIDKRPKKPQDEEPQHQHVARFCPLCRGKRRRIFKTKEALQRHKEAYHADQIATQAVSKETDPKEVLDETLHALGDVSHPDDDSKHDTEKD